MSKTSKRNKKVRDFIIKSVEVRGFTEDRYGNWKSPDGNYRMKFQTTSYRYERRIDVKPSLWVKLSGKYYKDIEIEV